MTEAHWRGQVMDLAMTLGWRIYAVENTTREIVRRSGARVRVRNVNWQGVGFPDLVMVRARDRRLLFVELKRGTRDRAGGQGGGTYNVTLEQQQWLDDLRAVANAIAPDGIQARSGIFEENRIPPAAPTRRPLEVYVWRPSDYDEVLRVLA